MARGLSLPLPFWGMLGLPEPQCLHLYRIVCEPKVPPSSISQTAPPEPGQHALLLVIPEPQTDPLTTLGDLP